MANVSRTLGFRPVKFMSGAPWNGQAHMYCIPASDSTACSVGDLVKITGAADAEGVAIVARCSSDSDKPVGVIVGFTYDKTYESQIHRTASTLRYALVVDDPDVMFEVQASGTFGYATDPGLNCGVTYTAVSTSTGASNMVLDLSTKATTSTLPFRIMGVQPAPINDLSDTSNVKVVGVINNHQFKTAITGV